MGDFGYKSFFMRSHLHFHELSRYVSSSIENAFGFVRLNILPGKNEESLLKNSKYLSFLQLKKNKTQNDSQNFGVLFQITVGVCVYMNSLLPYSDFGEGGEYLTC